MDYQLQFRPLLPYWPFFLRGLLVTLQVTGLAIILGTLLGLLLAAMRLSRVRIVSWLARAIVDVIRGIPGLVLLVYIYYGLSMLLGIDIPALAAGVIGLGVYYGAYMSETFRAGILAVDPGEIEAAVSLGMTRAMVFRRVTLPQSFRIILPAFANNFISMLKDSSLVSTLAVTELMRQGQQVVISTFRAFEVFTVVALIYYLMTTVLAKAANMLERRMGLGT